MTREGTKQMTVKSRSHLLDGFNDEDITLRTFNGDHCEESTNHKGGFSPPFKMAIMTRI